MLEFLVNKRDLRDARMVEVAQATLADGAIRLRLGPFSLTANNITYAAMGEGSLGYWDFFPATEGWGKPPCWGFATVIESKAAGVEAGARFYGYYPIAETLDVIPVRTSPRGFIDGAAHRAAKAAVYNHYLNVTADPAYDPAFEPEQTLFRPLYATGWWAADFVQQSAPKAVVISSASAKTALATAHQLRSLGGAELIALTSPRNAAYVRDCGLYDQTLTYDEVASLHAKAPVTYVDFLGRDEVIAAAHRALEPGLTRSVLIGAADWADKEGGIQPPKSAPVGPMPEFFFVPDYAAGRLKASPELGARMQADMRAFYATSRAFVTPRILVGREAIGDSWARLAAGTALPQEGLVHQFA
jgi:hypothetical protein